MALDSGTDRLSRNVSKKLGTDFLTLWDGTDRLSQNFGKELWLYVRCVMSQKGVDLIYNATEVCIHAHQSLQPAIT